MMVKALTGELSCLVTGLVNHGPDAEGIVNILNFSLLYKCTLRAFALPCSLPSGEGVRVSSRAIRSKMFKFYV